MSKKEYLVLLKQLIVSYRERFLEMDLFVEDLIWENTEGAIGFDWNVAAEHFLKRLGNTYVSKRASVGHLALISYGQRAQQTIEYCDKAMLALKDVWVNSDPEIIR